MHHANALYVFVCKYVREYSTSKRTSRTPHISYELFSDCGKRVCAHNIAEKYFIITCGTNDDNANTNNTVNTYNWQQQQTEPTNCDKCDIN